MAQNSFISMISQDENKENRGFVEFQIVGFTNKIDRLTSHLQLHKKDYLSEREICFKFWENVTDCWLICQKKTRVHYKEVKELIDQMDKTKTRVDYKQFKELIDQLEKKTC